MHLLEYQGKQLLERHGISVPTGRPAASIQQAIAAEAVGYPCVVKAKVQIGGAASSAVSRSRGAGRRRSRTPSKGSPRSTPTRSLHCTSIRCSTEDPQERMAKHIAGFTSPPGKTMGHAGAIVSGSAGGAQATADALQANGVRVGRTPTEVADITVATLAA
jgi:succinyl-CoA synthetase beta subunit